MILIEVHILKSNSYETELLWDDHMPRLKMAGLDPDKKYVVRELNRTDG